MSLSTSELISGVFDKYACKITNLSMHQNDTMNILNEMCTELQTTLSTHYYMNVYKFVSSVDMDDIIATSPPKSNIISNIGNNINTPQKKDIRYINTK